MKERIAVWTVAVAALAAFVLAVFAPPSPSAGLAVAVLAAFVLLPLSFVAVGWLLAVRGENRLRSRSLRRKR